MRVVGYHPLPNGRATARRRVVLFLLIRVLAPLARRRVILSSEGLRHCASSGNLVLVRMLAPVRASSGNLVSFRPNGSRVACADSRSVCGYGPRSLLTRSLLLDADSSTRRVGVGDQLKLTVVLSAGRRITQLKIGLSLDPTRTPAHRHGESAVGRSAKSGRSLRRSADNTAKNRSLSLFCSTRLQHTARRRRRSAKNRSLSIRCGLQHTGTASRRSVVS